MPFGVINHTLITVSPCKILDIRVQLLGQVEGATKGHVRALGSLIDNLQLQPRMHCLNLRWNDRSCLGSVRKVMSQTPHGARQRNHRRITFRKLVEARNDAAVLLQPAEHTLDDIALAVLGFVLRFMLRRGITGCIRYRSQ